MPESAATTATAHAIIVWLLAFCQVKVPVSPAPGLSSAAPAVRRFVYVILWQSDHPVGEVISKLPGERTWHPPKSHPPAGTLTLARSREVTGEPLAWP